MNTFIHVVIWIVAVLIIWIGAKFFADKISDYEVIEPEDGVQCIVVSRAFNTSVDCWVDND